MHAPSDDPHLPALGLNATVKFTFQDGITEYPEIIQGTGDVEMDNLILRHLAAAQAPKPIGPHVDEPHEFVLVLQMLTPLGSIEDSVRAAIDYVKIYSKEALLEGAREITTVGFDYLDGKTSTISVAHSSNDHYLDKASMFAVSKASLPLPVSELRRQDSAHGDGVLLFAQWFELPRRQQPDLSSQYAEMPR